MSSPTIFSSQPVRTVGLHLDPHLLESRQRLLEHVQIRRLPATRWTYQHQPVSHDDHLVQLDHLRASKGTVERPW